MAAQRPVYFDGRQLRRLSASEFLDDAVLSPDVVLIDGSRSFTATVAGIDPVLNADLATKRYTDRTVGDLSWHAPLQDALTTPPSSPTEGQRWLVVATATAAWTGQENKIAVWRNASWVFLTPTEGWTTFNRTTNAYIRFDGSAWVSMASAIQHNSLVGLQGGQSAEYYHLTAAQHTALTSSQAQRLFFATPTGGAGAPSMRGLALTDIPAGTNNDFLRTVGGAVVWGAVTAATVGAVPTSRTVNSGDGLSGGGDLSADRTLSWNGLGVAQDGTAVGTRRTLNIIGGRAAVADDAGNNRVDVTLLDPTLMAMVFGG